MDLMKLEDAKTYVQRGIFPAAKKIIEESGTHYPLTFVFATRKCAAATPLPEPEVVAIPFGDGDFSEAEREGYTAYIRHVITETAAVGVVTVTEAWTATLDLDKPGEAAPRASEAPNREEILAVFFEHRDCAGTVFWKAPIVRWGNGVTLAAFEAVESDQSVGRFANLLGKLRPPEAEA